MVWLKGENEIVVKCIVGFFVNGNEERRLEDYRAVGLLLEIFFVAEFFFSRYVGIIVWEKGIF